MERTLRRDRGPARPAFHRGGYTDITDGKEAEVAEGHALLLSAPAPMELTIPAEIGNYLPLEVKLNIVLEVAFNSSQPGTRRADGLPLHFPRIKAVRCDKNVNSVDTALVRS
ncbi:MAG TPA: hypothetical protein VHU16_00455 [Candidatus Udaeobacter sp.]|nr:hypothetical protein [Candidatus Udaeobacter sp.]